MAGYDIREVKKRLRAKYKEVRRNMPPEEKAARDAAIFETLSNMHLYRRAKMLVIYVSTPIEVDTRRLISHALGQGKAVVVPRCIDGTRLMEFYRIRSLDDLEKRTFGVLEPKVEQCEKVEDFDRSICIVPGLSFDYAGYRLGYGGGYYDRFLEKYPGMRIGVCYANCVDKGVPRGRFDRQVHYLVTDRYVRKISGAFATRHKRPKRVEPFPGRQNEAIMEDRCNAGSPK